MLNKMSEAIRSNLTKQQRLKIVSLVTIEVHARDILERLIKTKTADGSAFEWLSQLRVYWDRVSMLEIGCMVPVQMHNGKQRQFRASQGYFWVF